MSIAALAAVLGVLVLSGCSSEQVPRLGFPDPVSEQGARTVTLWQGSWLAAFIVGGLVWGLIGWVVIFHRKRPGHDTLPVQTRYNLPIEILYTVTPILIVLVLFYFTWRDQNEILDRSPNPDVNIQVVGKQWSWDFNYLDDNVHVEGITGEPPTLVLPQGETVQFTLTSPDVIHSFWVPALIFKMDVFPHDPNIFQIRPTKLGSFAGRCAELCGKDHSRMLFTLKIVTPAEYDDYIQGLSNAGLTGFIMPELMDQRPGTVSEFNRVAPGDPR